MKELHFALTGDLQQETIRVLFGKRDNNEFRPERGFIGIIHSGNGEFRRTLFLRSIVPQEEGWVTETPDGLKFSAHYFSRAFDLVVDSPKGAGILLVHSHPGPEGKHPHPPRPSRPDLHYEKLLLSHSSQALPDNSPIAAGIVSSSGMWRVREYKFPRKLKGRKGLWHKSSEAHHDVSTVRILDPDRLRLQRGTSPETSMANHEDHDSTLRLWGEDGQRRLAEIRVGIVGVGGVGSILTEFLARLGVRELVLLDFDLLRNENFNRALGARHSDVGKPKVNYVSRAARNAATSNKFKVRTMRGSASELTGLVTLLDCDIVLNASDSAFGRQVLDHASYAYFPSNRRGHCLCSRQRQG